MLHYHVSPRFFLCRKDGLNKGIPGRPVAFLSISLVLFLQCCSRGWNGYYYFFQSHSSSYSQSFSISPGFLPREFFVEYLTIPKAPLNPINRIARKAFEKVPNRENSEGLSWGPLLFQGKLLISVFSLILFIGCCNIPS